MIQSSAVSGIAIECFRVKAAGHLIVAGCLALTLLLLSSCAGVRMRESTRVIPEGGVAYLPYFLRFEHLPSWVTLYSVLPGGKPAVCGRSSAVVLDKGLEVRVAGCSQPIDAETLEHLVRTVSDAAGSIEGRLHRRARLARVSIYLVPPGASMRLRDTRMIRPHALKITLAVRFGSELPNLGLVAAVRALAHEVFHMAADSESSELPNEVRASLFASCVEKDVFGTLSRSFESPDGLVGRDEGNNAVLDSLRGHAEAAALIRAVTDSERGPSDFEALCRRAVGGG